MMLFPEKGFCLELGGKRPRADGLFQRDRHGSGLVGRELEQGEANPATGVRRKPMRKVRFQFLGM